jgi:hypothetical protein
MTRILLLLASIGCLSAVACSTSTKGGSGDDADACAPYTSDADLVAPAVSFKSDVIPVFASNCSTAGATCHGDPGEVAAGLQRPFLGLADGGTDPTTIINGIVGVASNEDPQMDDVSAGDPSNSYMMHKLDGDQCTLAAGCATGATAYTTCGVFMPQTANTILDQPTRDTIRRWIAQGANNN